MNSIPEISLAIEALNKEADRLDAEAKQKEKAKKIFEQEAARLLEEAEEAQIDADNCESEIEDLEKKISEIEEDIREAEAILVRDPEGAADFVSRRLPLPEIDARDLEIREELFKQWKAAKTAEPFIDWAHGRRQVQA